ncbi:MAG: hypothetical protein RLY57_283 [Candidatus Parcubacteria bacterium]|jgi:hypothetical protein
MIFILALKGKALYLFLLFFVCCAVGAVALVVSQHSRMMKLITLLCIGGCVYSYHAFKNEFDQPLTEQQIQAAAGLK